jgi:hypothetical protein
MRLENDGDGTPSRVYDGLGRLMSGRPVSIPGDLASHTSPVIEQARGALARIKGSAGVASLPATADRNWVDWFVLTASGHDARTAALVRQYGQGRVMAAGLTEYVVQQDSVTTTVEVDPSLAAIVSKVEQVGGVVRRRWTFSYDKAADGTATKREIRVEALAGGGAKTSRVMITRYNNIQFAKGTGA